MRAQRTPARRVAFITKTGDKQVSRFDRVVSKSSVVRGGNEYSARILELSVPMFSRRTTLIPDRCSVTTSTLSQMVHRSGRQPPVVAASPPNAPAHPQATPPQTASAERSDQARA